VLRADQALAEVPRGHQRADWRLHRHIERQKLVLWHEKNRLAFQYVCRRVHASIVSGVVPELEFRELGATILHPIKHVLESFALWVVKRNALISF